NRKPAVPHHTGNQRLKQSDARLPRNRPSEKRAILLRPPDVASKYTSGRPSPQDRGRWLAISPLPCRFRFERPPFCLVQSSSGLQWASGVLPEPIPCWLSLCCSRLDLLNPSEASDSPDSLWPRRNGAGQAGRSV